MSSLKMTFSLTSLILIFAMAFVPTAVMAAEDGPTPTITEYSGAEEPNTAAGAANLPHEQERTDFRLLVTFDALVTGAIAADNFTVTTAEAVGKATTTETTTGISNTITAITLGANANKAYMVVVNLDTLDSDYSQGYVSFILNADVVTGNQAGHSTDTIQNQRSLPFVVTTEAGNLPKNSDWTVTAALDATNAVAMTDGKIDASDPFNVKFTFSGGTGDIPTLTTGQIQVKKADGTAVDTSDISVATPTVSGLVSTVVFTAGSDPVDTPIFIGVNPNWADAVPDGGLRIPAEGKKDPKSVQPTVDISLIGTPDEVAETFQVRFAFAKATDVGADEVAADLPGVLMADQITITKEEADPADPTMMVMVESDAYVQDSDIIMLSAGRWVATVHYEFDALPLYVGLSGIDVSATSIDGTPSTDASPALMVGDADPTDPPPDPTVDPPAKPDKPSALINATDDLVIDVTWTAVTDADEYTVTKYGSDGMVVKTFPDDDPNTTSITGTSYSIGPVPVADRGMSFTITVTAENAGGESDPSDASDAVTIPAAAPVTDTVDPTVEITVLSVDANGKHTLDPGGTVRFMLLFSEALKPDPNSVSRLQVEDFTIVDHNYAPLTGATLSSATTNADGTESYILTVPAGTDPQEVKITLNPRQVTDLAGNELGGTPETQTAKFDTVPPDVTITVVDAESVSGTPYTFTGEPSAKLTFQFAFTEALSPAFTTTDIHRSVSGDNFTLLADSDPQPVSGMPNTYRVIVTVQDMNASTTVLIKRLEIADAAKNLLQNDRYATYSPATTAPVASVSARGPFYCGLNGNLVTVTITDNESIKTGETIAASEITVSQGWKIRTGSFRATTSAKSATATFRVVRNDVENAADRTWLGLTSVTVTVAADAVIDNTDQGNAAKAEIYTAGPVITVPAGQYVVVVRDNAWSTSHLNFVRTLYLGDYNVRAENVQVQTWDCMPDLGLIFDVTVDASPGIGGGGLMVLQSPDHKDPANPTVAKGTVGISEIMWSEDRGLPFGASSNLQHAREQWIELHNTNTFDVTVTLFDLIRDEAYRTHDAGRAGLIDVMSNYDIGGRWDVQEKDGDGNPKYGTDGNSEFGHDFVSMKRVAPAADKNYAHGEKQGRAAGHWSASTSIYYTRRAGLAGTGQIPLDDLNYHFLGSPGRANTFSAPGPVTRTNLTKNLIFNEVSNRRDQALEWIELKNVSDAEINLKKYQISYVTAKGTDTLLYNFPDNDNIKLAAGELLLLLDTSPRDNDDHPIAVAFDRDAGNDQGLGIGADAIKYKVANFAEGGLPDDGKFVLILRNRNDRLKSHEGVLDAIGYDDDLADAAIHTNLWPLKYFNGTLDARNTIAVETVHRRQHVIDPDKNTHGDDKDEHQALRDAGYTGVGYKRHAQRIAAHGGTPGHEDTRKNLVADIADTGVLTISEIMFAQGDGDYPQWIEIYNSSATQPVNLHSEDGWRLRIENFDDGEIPIGALSGTLNFKNSDVQTILPQQTVMVASTRLRTIGSAFFDTSVFFPATRVFSVYDDARGELGQTRSRDPILSERGFYIELIDGKGNFSDGVGNLVKSPNRRVAATVEWELSAVTGEMMDDDPRSSILRRYNEYKGSERVKQYNAKDLEEMGVTAAGWLAAHETNFLNVRQTWYGHETDIGSPGITGGRVLPVSLAKFRPERLDDGSIVVRWITESELNNAGFNILRSETSDGQFTQINTSLIAGQGTTSERTTYEWKDSTAKPNVVYYYQIQDVSLDGKVQTLRQSRLKGDVSAAGKLTTTWGELKALQ